MKLKIKSHTPYAIRKTKMNRKNIYDEAVCVKIKKTQ